MNNWRNKFVLIKKVKFKLNHGKIKSKKMIKNMKILLVNSKQNQINLGNSYQ